MHVGATAVAMFEPNLPSIFPRHGRMGRVLTVLWSGALPFALLTACSILSGFGVVGGPLLSLDLVAGYHPS